MVYVVPAPLSYYSGFNLMFGGLVRQNKTVLLQEFDPHAYLSCVEVYILYATAKAKDCKK